MPILTSRTFSAQLQGSVTVHDLKVFLAEAERAGISDDADLSISEFKGDQRDPGYVKITIRG